MSDTTHMLAEPWQESSDPLLRSKRELEAVLMEAPTDGAAQKAYLENLAKINRCFVGLLSFRWPEVPYPLYLRCGSTDLNNFVQVFVRREYDIPLPLSPRRILDLGAYAGYAAVFLAQRFPTAEIVSVEPSVENFRLLLLNTSAYPQVRHLNAAVWSERGRLSFNRTTPGDWGMKVSEPSATRGEIVALDLPDILRTFQWEQVDFLKCDIEGAEREVFAGSGAVVAKAVHCCAVELHEASSPGCERAVAACFDQAIFEHTRSGEYHVFTRRIVKDERKLAPPIYVLRPDAGVRPSALQNVPMAEWGYYTFDSVSCQLNATPQDSSPAALATELKFSGQDTFDCEVMVENPQGHGVTFGLAVHGPDGCVLTSASVDVAAGGRGRWICPVGSQYGCRRIVLTTRMVAGSPTNHQVRAFWKAPRFLEADGSTSSGLGAVAKSA